MRIQTIRIAVAAILLGTPAFAAQAPSAPRNTCVSCHLEMDEEAITAPVRLFEGDIHREAGLSCVNCHGGDATAEDIEESMDPKKGYVGRPAFNEVGRFCGKCHSDLAYMRRFRPMARVDQWTEYQTSVHGQKNQAGDQRVATCISCHGVHGIKAASDPGSSVYPINVSATCAKCHSDAEYMKDYGISTDQSEKYERSVHAFNLIEKRDLSAPTCNDCHGNHGAAPPGVASVSFVCGQCHTRQQRIFNESAHAQPFAELEMAACMTCHDNHAVMVSSDDMLDSGDEGVCMSCHETGDRGDEVRGQLLRAVRGLDQNIVAAEQILSRAERAGMEVSGPKFQLNEAHEKLIQARVLVHSVDVATVLTGVQEGMEITQASFDGGTAALGELDFRRRGLLASLVFILLAALGLYMKIRKMET